VNDRVVAAARSWWMLVLTLAVCAAVTALAASAYGAIQKWRRSSVALLERETHEGSALLVTALTRDMHGAQALVLANRDSADYASDGLPDFRTEVSAAFTRFPYPESFFGWKQSDDELVVFNRANREPPWASAIPRADRHPVIVVRNPALATSMLSRIRADAARRRAYSSFETVVDNVPYQVVARLQYADPFRDELKSVTGFMVNLDWVRRNYFTEIVSQVSRIEDGGLALSYAVLDDAGGVVAGTVASGIRSVGEFPLDFFDPWTSELYAASDGTSPMWKVQVSAELDPALMLTVRGADWTLLLISVTVVVLLLSFVLLTKAVRTSASVAGMRTEFVSTVTHELKTPIAAIRGAADTLLRGRLNAEGIREYAGLLVQESRRLARLVDNLLAYSRVTDVTELYSFERVTPAELVEDALAGFRQPLTERGFDVVTDVPQDLPALRGDATALRLALDNLIDNAIRYSGEHRVVRINARPQGSSVVIEVQDRGPGIPAAEVQSVQRRFVRGSKTRTHGSGLGLAIVNRVASDHGGAFQLQSDVGHGTTARLIVPVFGD
jgi:signal transduction histidine kinase